MNCATEKRRRPRAGAASAYPYDAQVHTFIETGGKSTTVPASALK
jgi:hypothetical protein